MARLIVIGTPIGNLSDVSERMRTSLERVDLLLCEDTRVSSRLLHALNISVPTQRCDEHVLERSCDEVVAQILDGDLCVGLVSDAGMPALSDPGQLLVDACIDAGIAVEVIPGPTAAVTALVGSGLRSHRFFFEGFLPRKTQACRDRLEELKALKVTFVLYEAPHRLLKTLSLLAEVCPDRRLMLARELTKLHEEYVRGSATQVLDAFAARPAIKGECVIVVEEPALEAVTEVLDTEDIEAAVARAYDPDRPISAQAKELAQELGLSKSEVYDVLIALRDVL